MVFQHYPAISEFDQVAALIYRIVTVMPEMTKHLDIIRSAISEQKPQKAEKIQTGSKNGFSSKSNMTL